MPAPTFRSGSSSLSFPHYERCPKDGWSRFGLPDLHGRPFGFFFTHARVVILACEKCMVPFSFPAEWAVLPFYFLCVFVLREIKMAELPPSSKKNSPFRMLSPFLFIERLLPFFCSPSPLLSVFPVSKLNGDGMEVTGWISRLASGQDVHSVCI